MILIEKKSVHFARVFTSHTEDVYQGEVNMHGKDN